MSGNPVQQVKESYYTTLLSPLTQSKEFKYLWLGQLFSLLGSSITMVILPVVVYSITDSTMAMGTLMAVQMLMNVLILPFSGIIVDSFHRIKIMMLTDIVRFVLLVVGTVLIVTEQLSMGMLYVMVGIFGLMEGLFQPAYSAVRAKVFTPEIRNSANALTQVTFQGVRLLGPSVGGLLITGLTAAVGFGIDALTFVVSFITLLFLRKMTFKKVARAEAGKRFSFKEDFLEGFAVLKGNTWLWVTILAFSVINIATSGMVSVLLPWLINVHFDFEPYVYGMMVSASGVGALISALIYGSRKTWRYRAFIAYGGIFVEAVALFLMTVNHSVPVLTGLMVVQGAGTMLFGLVWETSLQELVPEDKFGRVVSLDMLGSFALLPLGFLLTGWLAEVVGSIETIVGLSIFTIVIVAVVLMMPGVRKYD